MHYSEAETIVQTALQLRSAYPLAPAEMILDAVMKDCNRDIDFTAHGEPFTSWLHPPSPFALLLREAFAPDIPLSMFDLPDDPRQALSDEFIEEWGTALQMFFGRYRLWKE